MVRDERRPSKGSGGGGGGQDCLWPLFVYLVSCINDKSRQPATATSTLTGAATRRITYRIVEIFMNGVSAIGG